jgi:hypothetical protein
MKLNKRRTIIGLVVAVTLAGGLATVTASNFGPQGDCGDGYCCVCYANNKKHKIWQPNLNESLEDSMDWVRTNIYAPTDLEVPKVGEHGNSDVAAYSADYGDSGWYGIVDCIDYASRSTCAHWHLHVNEHYGPYSEHSRRAISCHEYGHTVGLQHTGDARSCMVTLHPSQIPLRLRRHDRRHINGRY